MCNNHEGVRWHGCNKVVRWQPAVLGNYWVNIDLHIKSSKLMSDTCAVLI